MSEHNEVVSDIIEHQIHNNNNNNNNEWKNTAKDLFAGTMAGMISKVIEYPFDTIKVRQQLEGNLTILGCVRNTLKEEGVQGLFRGLSAPLFGAMAENAIVFSVYSKTKRTIDRISPLPDSSETPLGRSLLAGSSSGTAVAFWLTPVEFVKVRLQSQHSRGLYRGPIDCIRQHFARDGIRGFFAGHSFTLGRESIGGAAYFGGYELFCKLLQKEGQKRSDLAAWQIILAGGMGGASYWSTIFPFDTIKSRVQAGVFDSTGGMRKAAIRVIQQEGFLAMYKGLGITLLRAMPSNGAIFATYELIMRAIADF